MISSIAKHRYFKGKTAPKSVRQYIAYVAYRNGADARVNGRVFFDEQADAIKAASVKALLAYEPRAGQAVLAHEIILSPGIQSVDAMRYTRTLMNKLGNSIGRDLNWAAVEHKGAHNHVHVLIDAKDKIGRRVIFRTEEYKRLREWGDQYLDRVHGLERFLKKEVDLDAPFEREKGDKVYERLFEKGGSESPAAEPQRPNYFKIWSKEKAIAELADEDKIYIRGKAFHQFSTSKELWAVLTYNRSKLTVIELKNVETWLAEKRDYGDDHQERLAREAFARKKENRRKKSSNQEDKDNSLKREQVHAKASSVNNLKSGLLSREQGAGSELPLRDNEKMSVYPISESDDEKAQLQARDDERLAQLKRESTDHIETAAQDERNVFEMDSDLANIDLSIIEFDRDFHNPGEFDQVVKQKIQQQELERRRVDLKIEQEHGTFLAQQASRTSNKDLSALMKGKVKQRMPRLKRDFRDQNQANKWLVSPKRPESSEHEDADEYDRFLQEMDNYQMPAQAERTRAADQQTSRTDEEKPPVIEHSESARDDIGREEKLHDLFFSGNEKGQPKPERGGEDDDKSKQDTDEKALNKRRNEDELER